MSRADNRHETSSVDQQTQFAGDPDAALRPRAVPDYVSLAPKPNAMHGIGLMMIGASFLIVASTGSVIAWTYFDATRQKPAPQIAAEPSVETQALQRSVLRLEDRTRQLQAELDGLAGPGGVLPRIIEQLQVTKQTDAAQTNAIQQLMQERWSTVGGTQDAADTVPDANVQGLGPIQVTPVHSGAAEQPQMVIVTPEVRTEGQGQ